MPRPTDADAPPIATATVARLYMEQGKLDQAEQIYRALIAEDPDDPRLAQGIAEIHRRREGSLGLQDTGDKVSLAREEGGALRCSWTVTDEGRAAAELVLGGAGRLVLRLVAFPIAPDAIPSDMPLETASGRLAVKPPESASLVGAAVGLLAEGGEFVSITHCRPLSL